MRYRYRNDEEMKDSGVEWIGKIPKDWEVKRIKHLFELKKDKSDEENPTVLSLTQKGLKIRDVSNNEGQLASTYVGYTKIEKNDFILNPMDLISGYTDKAEIEGVISPAYTTFRSKNKVNINHDYYKRYFQMHYHHNFLFPWGEGVSFEHRWTLKNEVFLNLPVITNSLEEQEKIANFLDEKTSQFDLIISKKEELIKKLEEAKKSLISEVVTGKVKVVKTDDGYEIVKRKRDEMKDSGVEWLGDIPKDWDVKRIKQISSVISKGTTPSTVGKEIIDNGEIRFLKAENIFEGKISLTPEFFIDEETNNILKRSELKEHDILFVIAGATIGKVAIVQKEHCPANTNQAISFIRLYDDINYKFVYYWLNSSKLQETMWLYAVQSAQPNLSMENLGNFYIAYPSEDEIYILTDYIEDKGIEISNIINNIKKQIEKLKEAKQSLISEAVTGKIEILD